MSGGADRSPSASTPIPAALDRLYPYLALAVLALAAFNLTFRLGREIVTEWDESLYAINAWEMAGSGNWIGTTFYGALDYYNTKPPLNVWLIALSFKALGVSLWSLRLPSVVSAFLSVALLQVWVRRAAGRGMALLASLVLATCFGFLYAHAGRSANSDALLAFLILLTVVTLWAARNEAMRLIWLGPILAAIFLLKGMAVLLPLAIVVVVRFWPFRSSRERQPIAWRALAIGALLFLLPSTVWALARWRLDGWQFLERLFKYDFVQETFRALEGHGGSPLFYLDVLQRDQFDWLLVGLATMLIAPVAWRSWRPRITAASTFAVIVIAWASLTLLVPTVMQTKLPWYLNPFYPAFAVALGWLVARAFARATRMKRIALTAVVVAGVGLAESRLIWYSFHHRDLSRSTQGMLLAEQSQLAGHAVFSKRWNNSDWFVLRALVNANPREVSCVEDFLKESQPGDYWYSALRSRQPNLQLVSAHGRHRLYKRVE